MVKFSIFNLLILNPMIPFMVFFIIFYALIRSFTLLTKYFYSVTNNDRVWKSIVGKYVIVTNPDNEFEEALCMQLAKKDIKLILLGFNESKLLELKAKLCKKVEVVTHLIGSTQQKDFSFLENYDIGLFINKVGPFTNNPKYFIDQNIDLVFESCFTSPMSLLKTVVTCMAERHKGYIVNIGFNYSIKPSPQFSIISSIKSAYRSWSESMYYEMMPYNVNVEYMEMGCICSNIHPHEKPNIIRPSMNKAVESILGSLGSSYFTVPYFYHFLFYICVYITPRFIMGRIRSYKILGTAQGSC